MKDVLVNYATALGSLTLSYWELQDDKNTSVVISPATTHDEGSTMETTSTTRLVEGLAFMRSRYSAAGISSSYSLVLDLRLWNRTMAFTYRVLRSVEAMNFR
jgi:hypothetical protein